MDDEIEIIEVLINNEKELKEFEFINELNINDEQDKKELIEALVNVNSFLRREQINFSTLTESVQFIFNIVENQINITDSEIREILRYVRKLFFVDLNDDEEKNINNYANELIKFTLNRIYEENYPERSIQQSRRCLFLNCLFADFVDDALILGISKYDYTFIIHLIESISQLTEKIICCDSANFKADYYFLLIDFLDKIIFKWLVNFRRIHYKCFKINFIKKLKSQIIILVSICKDNFKLISLSLIEIIDNLDNIKKQISKT